MRPTARDVAGIVLMVAGVVSPFVALWWQVNDNAVAQLVTTFGGLGLVVVGWHLLIPPEERCRD